MVKQQARKSRGTRRQIEQGIRALGFEPQAVLYAGAECMPEFPLGGKERLPVHSLQEWLDHLGVVRAACRALVPAMSIRRQRSASLCAEEMP